MDASGPPAQKKQRTDSSVAPVASVAAKKEKARLVAAIADTKEKGITAAAARNLEELRRLSVKHEALVCALRRAQPGRFQDFAAIHVGLVAEHMGKMLSARDLGRLRSTAKDLEEAGKLSVKLWSESGVRMGKALAALHAKCKKILSERDAAIAALGPMPGFDQPLYRLIDAWKERRQTFIDACNAKLDALKDAPRSPHLPDVLNFEALCDGALVPWSARQRPPPRIDVEVKYEGGYIFCGAGYVEVPYNPRRVTWHCLPPENIRPGNIVRRVGDTVEAKKKSGRRSCDRPIRGENRREWRRAIVTCVHAPVGEVHLSKKADAGGRSLRCWIAPGCMSMVRRPFVSRETRMAREAWSRRDPDDCSLGWSSFDFSEEAAFARLLKTRRVKALLGGD